MAENQSVYEDIQVFIGERFGVETKHVTPDLTFEELGADSLDRVEMVMELEDKYNVHFDDKVVLELNTIGEAVSYIDQLLNI